MLAKTFRPLFVAAAIAFMLMATVEAAPAADALRCQICDDYPQCEPDMCPGGYYCQVNYCTCLTRCIKGNDPRK
ncbi:hypothetical protein BG006_000094 [Podila minutissima]|uniref:Uncharacterized protein n=1 Tax=Podila minutissima TaxID=64525 RepID=A0A9P5SFF8_9FUNG|nr:hypothetical protein BG006_000094 [Podila minutissima]